MAPIGVESIGGIALHERKVLVSPDLQTLSLSLPRVDYHYRNA